MSTILFLKAVDKRDGHTGDMFGTHVEARTRADGVVQNYRVGSSKQAAAAADKPAAAPGKPEQASAPKKHKIELIEGTMKDAGGYSVNGKRYVGDEHESLVDEAKQMAYSTGRPIEDVIHHIMPQEHLDEADGKPLAKSILFLPRAR